MTYTQINQEIRSLAGTFIDHIAAPEHGVNMRALDRALQDMPDAVRIAYGIILLLRTKRGFNPWWDPALLGAMGRAENDEIFAQMVAIIEAELALLAHQSS